MLRGEIWKVKLDPAIGAEIRKSRPVVIVGDDRIGKLPLRVIVPLTDWKENFAFAEWMVKIEPDNLNHLDKLSAADTFQIRSISIQRFDKRIGELPDSKMQKIENAIAVVVKIRTL